jgi:autotransporter-associated beta strand protein
MPDLNAATYYWDSNDSTAGFGTAQGTWAAPTTNDATQGWSLSSAGTNVMSGTMNTTAADTLWFGTNTTGLAEGTITVSGNVTSGLMNFGSATGNITLSGGNITLGGNINVDTNTASTRTITSNITLTASRVIGTHQRQNNFIFTGVISGAAGAGLTYTSTSGGTLTLTGMNTFTGNFAFERGQVAFNSIADVGLSSSLGAGSTIIYGLSGAQPTTFWYTGASSSSSNKTWSNVGANSLTIVAQEGSMQLTGNMNFTTTVNVPINLTGTADTGINEISGNISDASGAGITSIAVNTTAPSGGSGEAGFWILSGSNSYVGATTVAGSSRLRIAHANALGTTAAGTTVQNGGVLELAGGISVGAEALSLNGTGISSGGAMRNSSGTNSYGGLITLADASRINSDADTLTLSGGITGSTRNLTIGGAGNTTISGNITTGTGTLTKDGAGTLTISSSGNTYSGTTTISQGTLLVTGNTSTSSHTVSSGAVLGGTGVVGATTVNGTLQGTLTTAGLTINSGGMVSPNGTGSVGTINTSSITINGGRYDWTINSATGSAGSDWDQITSTGALTSSGLLTVYAYGTPGDWDGSASYNWDIISANSMSGFSTNNFALDLTNFGIAAGNRTGTWSFSNPSGGIIRLSYAPSGDPVWTGGTGNFSTGFSPAASNGDDIAFSGAGGTATNDSLTSVNDITFRSGAGAYMIAGTALTVNGSILNSSTSTQTINTDLNFAATRVVNASAGDIVIGGVVSGSGGLTKDGLNTLTLSANNTFNGPTTINGGMVVMGHANSLGTSADISFTGGGLTYGTGITIDLSSRIKDSTSAILVDTNNNNVTFSSVLDSTNSGGLTKSGSGTLTLTASNTYTGPTTINGGMVVMGHANSLGTSGNISFTGGGLQYGTGITIDLSSRIKDSSSAISVDTDNNNVTFSSVLDSTNSGGLTKSGSGTLTLNANNAYTGATTVNGGTLEIGAAGRLGGGSYAGAITINGSLIYSGTNAQTLSGIISGTGDLTKNASGTLTLSGNNTYNGTITVSAGSLTMANTAANNKAVVGNIIVSGGTLNWSNANQIADTASVTTTSGVLNLSQTETINSLSVTGGTVDIGSAVVSSSAFSFTGGSSTIGVRATNFTFNGPITFGNFTFNWAAASASSNGITIGGNISVNNSTTANFTGSGGRLTLNANRIIDVGTGANMNVEWGIVGTGYGITKDGAGTLTLTNANSYSGGTTLNTGTLVIGNTAAAGSGTITQTDGTSLLTFDTTGTIANAMSIYNVSANKTVTLSGGITVNNAVFDVASGETLTISNTINGTGGVTKDGTGTLVLSGNNTYSAPTVINSGTLNATSAGALGSNNTVQVNGGTLLVTADDAINGKNIELGGSGIGLQFSGNYSGAIGNLTLSANSIIDLGGGSVQILFQGLNSSNHTLSFYNWSGTTLWNGGNGTTDTDKVYFGPDLSDEALAKIYFYSGPGDSFLGSGFELMPQTTFEGNLGYQIIPVPEPETYATGLLLVLGGAWWMWKRNRNTCQRALAG